MYYTQFASFRTIQSVQEDLSEFGRDDKGYREFIEMDSPSYTAGNSLSSRFIENDVVESISLSPESQSHLRSLQSLVYQHQHFNVLTINNPINVINSFEHVDNNNMEPILSQISSNEDLSFNINTISTINTINTINTIYPSFEDNVQDQFQSLKQMYGFIVIIKV